MTDKEKVSIFLKRIETIMYKLIDDKKLEPFNMFDALAITMDEIIGRKEAIKEKPIMKFRIRSS